MYAIDENENFISKKNIFCPLKAVEIIGINIFLLFNRDNKQYI